MFSRKRVEMKNNSAISTAAIAAKEYIHACRSGSCDEMPAPWRVQVDDNRHVGMSFNPKEYHPYLIVGRAAADSHAGLDLKYGASLLRHGFSTRFGTGLIAGASQALGVGLNMPIYTECDASYLEEAIVFLARELDRLEGGADIGTAFPRLQDTMYMGEADASAGVRRDFERLAASCGIEMQPGDMLHFEVLFGDLPGRISLHPLNRHVIADFFLADARGMDDLQYQEIIKNALLINQQSLLGHSYSIGLADTRLIACTGRRALEKLDDDAWPAWLQYHVAQARSTRALIHKVGMLGLEINFSC